ncbi:hypothetical protein CC1G_10919 [Coprinopsis cinerea okayama7|uniref:RRM domain-containing protein n=1 Tax=Coprinopsis cinerea (strain Okayama-7 / 130 / ATCC MYA-4618 / FGSC 9003) TaxID=240176 RepID=A8NT20_COPC7|nr:hypothetical protein CC1G_10919 [Coprinopsis cinerea okayama7\|eukprot:XP_001836138.1 hypothetical protein CC1G_10919 [Coprinopsis cinerea okayama7\
MPPKKAKKIALSEFLGDTALGSWADEMEDLPSAPAPKIDEDAGRDSRFGRRDDFSRPERPGFAREDVPLPTNPPYTAFVGNLAFDLVEDDIANHFADLKINNVKIIKDRDDRPKGFGYVEFQTVDDLKEALGRTGSSLAGRAVRVSVAEPPKERSGFGGHGHEDDSKFDSPWRRDGPLPDLPGQGRRRFDPQSAERAPSITDTVSDWRSSRPRATEPDTGGFRRKGSGNFGSESAADKEETWSIGSRFKPSTGPSEDGGSRFGSMRSRGDFQPRESPADEGDWRSAARPPRAFGRSGGSPTDSTPPTPQMGRKKLELLPRSGPVSASPSPLSSPKLASQPAATSRPNPFGGAKPVDVTQREREVEQKLEAQKERIPISRTSSRTASERTAGNRVATPPPSQARAPASPKPIPAALNSTVRPTFSFANAAAAKKAKEGGETVDQSKAPEASS